VKSLQKGLIALANLSENPDDIKTILQLMERYAGNIDMVAQHTGKTRAKIKKIYEKHKPKIKRGWLG
jgi:hypothetical protein